MPKPALPTAPDDYHVAIPSHRRVERLAETLEWLRSTTLDMDRLTVFLSDDEDMESYARLGVRCVRTGAANVTEKFNAIHEHYEPGQHVFVLEDDVTVVEATPGDTPDSVRTRPVVDLHALITDGFSAVLGGGLWSVAPHSNGFFYSGKTTESLKLAVAHAFGFVATRDPALRVSLIGKSDYERTILYFIRYGRVVRVDRAGVATKSYTADGGMQADMAREERAKHEQAACDYLVRRFPHLVQHNPKKKSLYAELTLRRVAPTVAAVLRRTQRKLDAERGFAGS